MTARPVLYDNPGSSNALKVRFLLIEPGGAVTGSFSIADIAAIARFWLLPTLPTDLGAFPKTRQMLDAAGSRPAYLAAL